jgi:membrane protein implicated in regulation of membrane protease activity
MWDQAFVAWLALGFALLITEMLTGTLFFLCLAPAAFATAAVAWLVSDPYTQWICFATAGFLSLFAWRHLRRKIKPTAHDAASALNNRTRHLVGRESVSWRSRWSMVAAGSILMTAGGRSRPRMICRPGRMCGSPPCTK